MSVPIVQQYRVAHHIIRQKLDGRRRYPLVLMLEPSFRCNLECAGCGKIDYPEEILNRRLSVKECLSASDECGAPIVAGAQGCLLRRGPWNLNAPRHAVEFRAYPLGERRARVSKSIPHFRNRLVRFVCIKIIYH